jgi:hypothetical protein
MSGSVNTLPEGMSARVNEMGLTAVRLHYSADPDKRPGTEAGDRWLDHARALFPDPAVWDAEFEINWFIAAGARVYPEFYESVHCTPLEPLRRKVVYRAWDFGWHAPACLIAQIDGKDRLCILREVVGRQQTTRSFAQMVVDRCADWFPSHTAGFQDFCDPAGQQAQPAAERAEMRDVEVLQAFQIYPTWEHGWSRKDGRALVHQLLRPRSDGTPSVYVDAVGCPVLMQGFLGKYVYPETRDGKTRDEPDEGNHPWADVHAALRYLATGLYSALGLRRFKYQQVVPAKVTTHGYGVPMSRRAPVGGRPERALGGAPRMVREI